MSLGLRTFAPVGCDMPEQGGIAGKPKLPVNIPGCDMPENGGIGGEKPVPTIGCDLPQDGGIAGKKDLSLRDKLALIGLSLGRAMTKTASTQSMSGPQMVVPPMTPGFPEGGIWA